MPLDFFCLETIDWWTSNQVSVVMSVISIIYPDMGFNFLKNSFQFSALIFDYFRKKSPLTITFYFPITRIIVKNLGTLFLIFWKRLVKWSVFTRESLYGGIWGEYFCSILEIWQSSCGRFLSELILTMTR